VVDCTGLENRRLERVREFESHRFRQKTKKAVDIQRLFFYSYLFSNGACITTQRQFKELGP